MDDRLKQLYDYTKFHIGIYLTLTTGILAILKFAHVDNVADVKGWLLIAIIFLVFAGIGGGAVASNISSFLDYDKFHKCPLPVFGLHLFRAKTWILIEHGAFWIGMGFALYGVGRYALGGLPT